MKKTIKNKLIKLIKFESSLDKKLRRTLDEEPHIQFLRGLRKINVK